MTRLYKYRRPWSIVIVVNIVVLIVIFSIFQGFKSQNENCIWNISYTHNPSCYTSCAIYMRVSKVVSMKRCNIGIRSAWSFSEYSWILNASPSSVPAQTDSRTSSKSKKICLRGRSRNMQNRFIMLICIFTRIHYNVWF